MVTSSNLWLPQSTNSTYFQPQMKPGEEPRRLLTPAELKTQFMCCSLWKCFSGHGGNILASLGPNSLLEEAPHGPPGGGFGLRDGAQVVRTATLSDGRLVLARLPATSSPPSISPSPLRHSCLVVAPKKRAEQWRRTGASSSTWSLAAAHLLPPQAHCVRGLFEVPHSAATNGDVWL